MRNSSYDQTGLRQIGLHQTGLRQTCLVLVLALASLLAACGDATGTVRPLPVVTSPADNTLKSPAAAPERAIAGSLAPDFQATDVSGQVVRLNELRGKGVIVNYWSVY